MMRLSMWILFDELERFHVESMIQDGDQIIDGLRILSNEEDVSHNNVYIGCCSEFFGTDDDSVFLVHGRDIILVKNANLTDIINCVISVFDKYRDWARRITDAFNHPNPFQAVLEIAHDIIESPMYFGQNNLQIYAITRQYSSEDVFEEWDTIKSLNTIPVRMIERMKGYNIPALYPDELDPAVMPVKQMMPEIKSYHYTIRTNCYLNGRIWGHLYVYYKKEKLSKSVTQFTRYIADVYERLLNRSHEHNAERYSRFSFLAQLLDGVYVSDSTILNLYSLLGWDVTASLIVYKITLSSQNIDKVLLNWIYKNLSERFTNTVIFSYQNALVLVSNRFGYESETLESAIGQFLTLGNYLCGASLPFCGLEKLASYYEQAGYAAETDAANLKKIHYFEEYAYTCLAKAFSKYLDYHDWIHPSLFRLKETDASQGTEYFKTLHSFLLNRGHYGNTVKELFIHRNTLTYRLSRIGSILNVDIHDERVFAYLRFCYELMGIDGLEAPGGMS